MLLDAVVDIQPDLHKTMKNVLLKRKIVGWIEVAMRHCAPEVAEHPPETPAVAEASTVIEIPRELETPRERMLKRLNALRIVHGSRPPK